MENKSFPEVACLTSFTGSMVHAGPGMFGWQGCGKAAVEKTGSVCLHSLGLFVSLSLLVAFFGGDILSLLRDGREKA